MLGQDPGSSRSNPAPSNEQRVPDSSSQPDPGADVQDDLDDQARIEKLCREGGVGLITELLSKAVPDEDVPEPCLSNLTFGPWLIQPSRFLQPGNIHPMVVQPLPPVLAGGWGIPHIS
ncbi:hypothetical protein K523DRAFT_127186 [Schizophyllum commune Tattone D]|nr:hypothetical protein K523DRAFT_127186 [Schizophyllum commune Tattone D]